MERPEVPVRRAGDRARGSGRRPEASADHRRGDPTRAAASHRLHAAYAASRISPPDADSTPCAAVRPAPRDRRRERARAGRVPASRTATPTATRRPPRRRPPRCPRPRAPPRRPRPRRPPSRRHHDHVVDHDHHPATGGRRLGPERFARQLHGVPGRQRVEPRRVGPARRHQLRQLPRRHRRSRWQPEAARRLRRRRRVRHPVHHRAGHAAEGPGRLHRLRRRERPRPVSDPARTHRSRTGATRTCSRSTATSCKLYELFAVERGRRPLVGCIGRGVRPDVERAAARGMDVGRRGRAAHLPRARALRRGGERAHRPRAALHRVEVATRVPAPGDALGVVVHRRQPPADGTPPAVEGELRRVRRTRARRASC